MDRSRLIEILRCPATLQIVREASSQEIAECNKRILAGEIINKSGVIRDKMIQAGLLRLDGALLFPQENGIPVMLLEEALVLC